MAALSGDPRGMALWGDYELILGCSEFEVDVQPNGEVPFVSWILESGLQEKVMIKRWNLRVINRSVFRNHHPLERGNWLGRGPHLRPGDTSIRGTAMGPETEKQ